MEKTSETEIEIIGKQETWFDTKWKPAMAWQFFVIVSFDLFFAPIIWNVFQTLNHAPLTQWDPITLKGAGLYYLAILSILGIASWTKGQEKLAEINAYGRMSSIVENRGNPITRYSTPIGIVQQRPIRPPSGTDLEDADALINRRIPT